MNVFLCNPLIRECRKLPPSILPLNEPPREPHGYELYLDAIGFGYDANSRDFKVVRVVHVFGKVRIFSLYESGNL